MAFDPITTPIDHVMIARQRTPGIAEVVGASSPRQWDERKGPDMSGASLRFRGKKLAAFSIKLHLATSEDFAAWAAFAPVVLASPVGGRGALDVVHPVLADLGIRSAVVEDVLQPTPDGENGGWVAEIKMKEYRPPRPAGNTARGSASAPTGNSETAQLQAEIARGGAQIEMLNAEAGRYHL